MLDKKPESSNNNMVVISNWSKLKPTTIKITIPMMDLAQAEKSFCEATSRPLK